MDIINAIAKARFASAKPQHIQLHRGGVLAADLLCLEAGQELSVSSGEWAYYVITGNATITCNGQTSEFATGQFAAVAEGEAHTLADSGEGRLAIIAVRGKA